MKRSGGALVLVLALGSAAEAQPEEGIAHMEVDVYVNDTDWVRTPIHVWKGEDRRAQARRSQDRLGRARCEPADRGCARARLLFP